MKNKIDLICCFYSYPLNKNIDNNFIENIKLALG